MSSRGHSESVLDRATVESETHNNASPSYDSLNDNDTHMSKPERLNGKAKSLLHVRNDHPNLTGTEGGSTLAASPNAPSSEARLNEHAPPLLGPQGFRKFVRHPVDTVKAKTERKTNQTIAGNLLSSEVTHAQDVELIRAQDTFTNAETDEAKLQASDDLESLKKAHQDLFIRWTMDRHVLKLKQLKQLK